MPQCQKIFLLLIKQFTRVLEEGREISGGDPIFKFLGACGAMLGR
jgi:hypothetical protein